MSKSAALRAKKTKTVTSHLRSLKADEFSHPDQFYHIPKKALNKRGVPLRELKLALLPPARPDDKVRKKDRASSGRSKQATGSPRRARKATFVGSPRSKTRSVGASPRVGSASRAATGGVQRQQDSTLTREMVSSATERLSSLSVSDGRSSNQQRQQSRIRRAQSAKTTDRELLSITSTKLLRRRASMDVKPKKPKSKAVSTVSIEFSKL